MQQFYKFLRDVFFSAGQGPAFVNDVFVYDSESLRGRFRGLDFQVPLSIIESLVNTGAVEQISVTEWMELLGFPNLAELISPTALAQAIAEDALVLGSVASQVAEVLEANEDFVSLVTGPVGPSGNTGPRGLKGETADPDPVEVAAILSQDKDFQDSVIGPAGPSGAQGIQGEEGERGQIGPAGLSHGITALSEIILADGDLAFSGSTGFEEVAGASVDIEVSGAQERVMIVVNAVGYIISAPSDHIGLDRPIFLDVAIDGVRMSGSGSGLVTGTVRYPYGEVNLSFTAVSAPLLEGQHSLTLMLKGIVDGVVALRAHRTTNKLRMAVFNY